MKIFAVVAPILGCIYYTLHILDYKYVIAQSYYDWSGYNWVSHCTKKQMVLPRDEAFHLKFIVVEDGDTVRSILQKARISKSTSFHEEIMDAIAARTARRFGGTAALKVNIRGLATSNGIGQVPYFMGEDICDGMTTVTTTSGTDLSAEIPVMGVQLAQNGIVLPRHILASAPRAQLCLRPTFRLAYATDRSQNTWCEAQLGDSSNTGLRTAVVQGNSSATFLIISGAQ